MRLLIWLFIYISLVQSLGAQDAVTVSEEIIADIFEQYDAETDTEIDFTTFHDELMYLAKSPINLNQSTREQLQHLLFLSDIQIENILAYIYQNKQMQTIYELQLINGLDMTDIRRMLPFVILGEVKTPPTSLYMADLAKYGKHELLLRFDDGLEKKAGYDTKAYLGSALYNATKYRYHFKDRVFVGFTAEKDAGEPYWGKQNKGSDFYSFHAQIYNLGSFKTLVVGDFRASFGQGLVMQSGFGLGKSSNVMNMTPRNGGLKKYSSVDEYNYFRGAGSTVQFGKIDLTAFYSNKMIDADTINGAFSSIHKTGLHRTPNESQKKHTVNHQIIGLNATINCTNFQIGTTLVKTLLDKPLIPERSVYNYFNFSGRTQTTGGIHYKMRWQKLNFYGETAMTNHWAISTINGMLFSPSSRVSLIYLQRYYSPAYDTFYATSFSESSRINNESGYYLGVEIYPFKRWKISAYADSYRFPWPKFGAESPSVGSDYLMQIDFIPQKSINMNWRLKYEAKQENLGASSEAILPQLTVLEKASIRYQLSYSAGEFRFKNVLEYKASQKGFAKSTFGLLALQDISYNPSNKPLKVDVRFQFFDATDYENRFYSYEKDILYAFSIPMSYGLGSRYYLNLRYEFNQNLSLYFKLAQTVYADDRESISSGNETIQGNRKTDFKMLMRWIF